MCVCVSFLERRASVCVSFLERRASVCVLLLERRAETVCVCVSFLERRASVCVLFLERRAENVCVCVSFLERRAAAERVSLWTGFPGQTAACRLGKRQSKWLCGALGSPATAGPLPDRLPVQPQSQCMWTLKMGAPRVRLQERRRTCADNTTELLRYSAHFSGLC